MRNKGLVRVGVDVGRGGEPLTFVVMDKDNNVLYSGSDPNEVRKYQIETLVIDEQDVSYLIKKGQHSG